MNQRGDRTPGVYVQSRETDSAVPLSSGITGLVGIAERGPLHVPQAIRNWGEFTQVFGGFTRYASLAHSVFGFFLNGGEQCFVVRVGATDAGEAPAGCPGTEPLTAASNPQPIRDFAGNDSLELTAINQGGWGNRIGYDIADGSQQNMALTRLIAAAAPGDNTVTVAGVSDLQPGMAIRIEHSGDPLIFAETVVNAIDPANREVALASPISVHLPRFSTLSGRGFMLSLSDGDQREVFDNLSMTPENPRYIESIVNGTMDSYIERRSGGHSILVRARILIPGVRPTPNQLAVAGQLAGGGDGFRLARCEIVNAISVFVRADAMAHGIDYRGRQANELRLRIRPFGTETALAIPTQPVALDRIVVDDPRGFIVAETVAISDPNDLLNTEQRTINGFDQGNGLLLNSALNNAYPLGAEVRVNDRFMLELLLEGVDEPIETHRNLSADPAGARYFRTVVNADSTVLCVDEPAAPLNPPAQPQLAVFSGGADPGDIDRRYYTGYQPSGEWFAAPGSEPGLRVGLAALESNDAVSLIAVPDLNRGTIEPAGGDAVADFVAAQTPILLHCAKMADRFALLDPFPAMTAPMVAGVPARFPDTLAKFGALYYPRLRFIIEGESHLIPASGPIAGVMALSDRLSGINKAPANTPVIKGAIDLETTIDESLRHALNDNGINCIRKRQRPALQIWGARTLSQALSTRYVPIRRLLLHINKSLPRTLLWAVFEPNDRRLQRRIATALNVFFGTLVGNGMTAGAGGDASYYVKCDAETNPAQARDAGQVIAEIGVALSAPAEFIVLTVRRTPESINIVEEER